MASNIVWQFPRSSNLLLNLVWIKLIGKKKTVGFLWKFRIKNKNDKNLFGSQHPSDLFSTLNKFTRRRYLEIGIEFLIKSGSLLPVSFCCCFTFLLCFFLLLVSFSFVINFFWVLVTNRNYIFLVTLHAYVFCVLCFFVFCIFLVDISG